MECSTVSHDSDCGTCTTLNEGEVRARKFHKCNECKGIICIGDVYYTETLVWEGEISTHKTCVSCLSIRKNMFSDGWFYGQLLDDLADHVYEVEGGISEACIAALHPKAKRRVCDLIEQYYEENEE